MADGRPPVWYPRLDAEPSQSVAALVGQEVLIAVPVDVALRGSTP
jgi:hypothetical protein